MDAITCSSVTLSKKEKKLLKLNPVKTEAIRIKVHENYTVMGTFKNFLNLKRMKQKFK